MATHLKFKSFKAPLESIELHPSSDPVNIYACGITPDGPAHVGHLRMYITIDLIIRIITYKLNRPVKFVMNVTDYADSIAVKAKAKNLEQCITFARRYEKQFFDFMEKFGNRLPTRIFRVTEYMYQIQAFVKKIYNDHLGARAYEDESIYFNGAKYLETHSYPTLLKHSKPQSTSPNFAIWKERTPSADSLFHIAWPDMLPETFPPLPMGIPGWHTECATFLDTMEKVDIHIAGRDLLENYHADNQYAQVPHIQCPIHVFVGSVKDDNGSKMSKSLKNAIHLKTIWNAVQPSGTHQLVRKMRLLCLYQNYDDPIFYGKTFSAMESIDVGFSHLYTRYYTIMDDLKNIQTEMWTPLDNDTYQTFIQLKYMIEVYLGLVEFSSILQSTILLQKEIMTYMSSSQPKFKLVMTMFTYFKFITKDIMGLDYETLPPEVYHNILAEIGDREIYDRFETLEFTLEALVKLRKEIKAQGIYETSDLIRSVCKRYGIFITDPKL